MIDPDEVHWRLCAVPYFTAERTAEGSRILLRGRRLERSHYAGDVYPTVVTVEFHYARSRADGLPTLEQHSQHKEIFLKFLDAVEARKIGIHVFADTTQGLTREWLYVNDASAVDQLRSEHLQGRGDYELCYESDAAWSFLDRCISQIRGSGWGAGGEKH